MSDLSGKFDCILYLEMNFMKNLGVVQYSDEQLPLEFCLMQLFVNYFIYEH